MMGADWLAVAAPLPGAAVPGLYIGEAGISVALLRAGQALNDSCLLDMARKRACLVSTMEHVSPDLFTGAAGRLRMHLILWKELRHTEQLKAAITAGDFLVSSARKAANGELKWPIPTGYGQLSGHAFLGYAHGAAGIGDVLIDLYECSGNDRFLAAAKGAALWLGRLARRALNDGSGAEWPTVEGGTPIGAMWCHGAAGIGQFLAHAGRHRLISNAAELARRAALTVAHGSRSLGPVQCHELAGNIEFLVDMFQTTGQQIYLAQAGSLVN